jgi:hypothetical protein
MHSSKNKACLTHLKSNIAIKIDCDNVLQVYQDRLLSSYCLLDSRFHKLSILLNKAAAQGLIKNASVYGLQLLLIVYMQSTNQLAHLQQKMAD